MTSNCRLFLLLTFPLYFSCGLSQKVQKQPPDILEELMKTRPEEFSEILRNRDSLMVQVIYSQIDRKKNNDPVITNYYFNVNPSKYYYPASTVKLPTALLALERLNEMKIQGLNQKSGMITEAGFSGQTPAFNDPTSEDGKPTIEHYIKKIFLVSDNDAFNRLYEFLGQEYINTELHKKGFKQTDILHRLAIFLSEEENRHTNPIRFLDDSSTLLYEQKMLRSELKYPDRSDSIGYGYFSKGELVKSPMNFSSKNRLPVEELHTMMRAVIFPATVKNKQRFRLTNDQYRFVWKYLSQFPSEGKYPPYDSTSYWDAYGKFLYWGGEKVRLPRQIRSFSKEGDAYGFLIDAAYIVDFDRKIEFMLTAVIYCNKDGILNDDQYDYEAVGKPFMKNLGKLIYDHESKRPRTRQPDLSTFRLDYQN